MKEFIVWRDHFFQEWFALEKKEMSKLFLKALQEEKNVLHNVFATAELEAIHKIKPSKR